MRKTFYLLFFILFFVLSPVPSLAKKEGDIKILVLGDSISDGYGIAKKKAFPDLLEKQLRKKGYEATVINAGISGSTTASAVTRLKWLLRKKPDILILELGANDGLRGIKVTTSKINLSNAILLAQKNNVKIILTGMKLPRNYGEKYRQQFESMFKDLAKKHKVTYMPFLLKGVGGVPHLNLPDGIHPNERGHQKITDNLIPYIEKLL